MKTIVFVILISMCVSAKEKHHHHREHGAHEHGAGQLGIAFDGMNGKIDLKIPAESIIGFEHEAKNDRDKKQKASSLAKLESKMSEMVVFDKSLDCKINQDKVMVEQEAQSSHGDVVATFSVKCSKSPIGSEIIFNFQKHFPRIHDLDVQIIADNVQAAVEAKKNNTKLILK